MDHFEHRDGRLHAEDVEVAHLAARFGTPLFVYSRATLERHWRAFDEALAGRPHRVYYAVKANDNLAVLDVLAQLGSGFDIVSVGELERVLSVGAAARDVLFSGVGKRIDEIERALVAGIGCFNVESEAELDRIEQVARAHGAVAPIALRVNPDVDPQTHPYIATGLRESKFGVDIAEAPALYRRAADSARLRVTGVDCHIGSQLTSVQPFVDAAERVVQLYERLRADGIEIEHLDLGGGLGIPYRDERPPSPAEWAAAIDRALGDLPCEIRIEPGRAIAGNAGILVTRVEYLKSGAARRFAIVDAAMNDLLRPSLYGAWQEIVPVVEREAEPVLLDVVGPVCESGDFLGRDRSLAVAAGDLLAVRSAGAYGTVMASNYNSRPRPAEVMVDGGRAHLVRARQALSDLWAGESALPRRAAAAVADGG
ncbi:MAG: diaminopimelate decarboxylase [Halofilum sp. (in: g-proteobacteria)]|nr:diaminopimelate decarboxylase [Halofilum sp. (in: g-proteobacteria)]